MIAVNSEMKQVPKVSMFERGSSLIIRSFTEIRIESGCKKVIFSFENRKNTFLLRMTKKRGKGNLSEARLL